MTVTTWFCPRCSHESPRPVEVSPACGHGIASDSPLAHEERLVSAVSHAVREHRMIAIRGPREAPFPEGTPRPRGGDPGGDGLPRRPRGGAGDALRGRNFIVSCTRIYGYTRVMEFTF